MKQPKLKYKIVKTELGFEPCFSFDDGKTWGIEPGFAKPTRAEAQAVLDADIALSHAWESESRNYRIGYDHACGYQD